MQRAEDPHPVRDSASNGLVGRVVDPRVMDGRSTTVRWSQHTAQYAVGTDRDGSINRMLCRMHAEHEHSLVYAVPAVAAAAPQTADR